MTGDIKGYNSTEKTNSSGKSFLITKSDTVDFNFITRGIYVGGTGDVVVVNADDTTVTFSAVPVGTILPVQARRVNSTSTTATLMVGMY